MTPAALLAFFAGALAPLALAELARTIAPGRGGGLLGSTRSALDALVRLGSEGREPGAAERRRLLAVGGLVAFLAAMATVGPLAALCAALVGPWIVARAMRARRLAYRRAVERGAGGIAVGMADAMSGGHSLRGAILEAAAGLDGAPGRELGRVAAELELGARTEDALEGMRERVRSQGVDAIVAATLVQRRAGGDLARLLRDCARAFEDQARLEGEARAATAQARFTGLVVVGMPVAAALFAELANPGFLRSLLGSAFTAWLVGCALMLQVVAAVAIRRFGRVPA